MCVTSQVNFSSLDIHLHTEALLNAMNFLISLLPPTKEVAPSQEELPTIPEEDEGEGEEGEKKEESAVAKKTCNYPFHGIDSAYWNLDFSAF